MPRIDARPYWQSDCGSAVVWCADCRDVLPIIASNSIPMIWTDPPFGHGNLDGDLQEARVRDNVNGARKKPAEPILNDAGEHFDEVMQEFLREAARILRADSCCCCCCCCGGGGPTPTFARVANWIDEQLDFFMAVVWDKSARGNGMGWRYRRNYEFVMVSHRKGGTLRWINDDVSLPNVVRDMPVINRVHPNEKPISLITKFIELHTGYNDLVLDPFMGVGSTGVACVKSGRRFVGVEIDRQWCDAAAARIQQALIEGGHIKVEVKPTLKRLET